MKFYKVVCVKHMYYKHTMIYTYVCATVFKAKHRANFVIIYNHGQK